MDSRLDDLRDAIEDLPPGLAGEVLDFVEFVRLKHGLGAAPTTEDHVWMAAGLEGLGDRLAALEADVPPAELEAWRASFEAQAKPCEYVPGRGFVVKP